MIDTVFFGGGTPSLLKSKQYKKILQSIQDGFTLEQEAEITTEANPGTVTRERLQELHEMGFTRISFGMQSAHPRDLTMLDRQHSFFDISNAIKWSKEAGFEHLNADLIFGIPGQTMARWQQNLRLAVELGVDHLSLYSLTIEEGTLLHKWYHGGLLEVLDDDLVADMYEFAIKFLESSGFSQYEISNWAKNLTKGNDSRCQHNLDTWRFHPYLGVGAGAHGFIDNLRTANVNLIPQYILKMSTPTGDWPAAETVNQLGKWEQMQEYMMVGLRLTDEGVSKENFFRFFGYSVESVFSRQIDRLLKAGLLETLEKKEERLRLTKKGVMLGNQVFLEFVGNSKPDFVKEDQ